MNRASKEPGRRVTCCSNLAATAPIRTTRLMTLITTDKIDLLFVRSRTSLARRTAFSNSNDPTTQKHQLGACAWTIAAFRCAVLFCFRSSRPFLVQASKIMNTPRPPQRAAALLCCLLLAMVALSRAALFDIDLLNTDASVTVRMYVL